ncbi:FAD/NAD(P)-binding domain-containing protein [Daedaleopsis nitida]|nr:FAD/NAD(P)-binding domain-containing protein [Daedaleopsis nitida]
MSPHRFRVAICGGGVGGLVCAVALSRYHDIPVDVYEAAGAFTEIGAGIGVWPRAWKVLCSLGLADELSKIAIVPPTDIPQVAFTLRKGDQPEGVNFYTLSTPGARPPHMSPARIIFHAVLLRHLGPQCRKFTGKRLISYTQSTTHQPRIRLEFQDGSSAACDILIGADGVKSAVRNCLVEELAQVAKAEGRYQDADKILAAAPPRWSGTVAYRAIIPADVLRRKLPHHRVLENSMLYLGKNSEITVYPMAHGKLINVAAFRARYDAEYTTYNGPWVHDAPQSEISADFDQWEPEVRALLQCADRVNRWAVHTTLPLPSFVAGRVALLGDAAHAMMPYQGRGPDAYVLAAVLGDPRTTFRTLDRALRVYDTVRRPFALRIQEASRENGILYTLNYPGLTFDRPTAGAPSSEDAAKLEEIRDRLQLNWEWAWKTTLDGDVARAVRMLDDPSAGS